MNTASATLVSQSKDGRRAMVVVRDEVDGKPYSATRHVERQSRQGGWVGLNPDPRTGEVREKAGEKVRFAQERLTYCTETHSKIMGSSDASANDRKRAQKDVDEAKAMLKLAEDEREKAFADFPLKVEFSF